MTYRRWLSIFALVLLATATLLALGAFHAIRIVRRPAYPESTGDAAIQLQDSAFTLQNTHCDVLIYGDSTANVGIDPRLIAATTGLSTCNIATNRPDVEDLGTLPVDVFLQHNPRPKLLVLQFGPEVFYRAKSPWEQNGPYTPLLLLCRNRPRAEALRAMLQHPAEAVQFILYIVQHEIVPNQPNRESVERQFHYAIEHARESNGQLDLNLPAQTSCRAPALALQGPLDRDWPQQLHRKYEAQGVQVVVRAAPIPDCDPQLALFQRDLAPLVDGNVEPMPIHFFVAGDRHTALEGSGPDTQGLIRLIQSRHPLHEPLTAPDGSPRPFHRSSPGYAHAAAP